MHSPPDRMTRIEQIGIVLTVTVPFAALLTALGLLWGGAVDWIDLSAFLIGYLLVGFGISVG